MTCAAQYRDEDGTYLSTRSCLANCMVILPSLHVVLLSWLLPVSIKRVHNIHISIAHGECCVHEELQCHLVRSQFIVDLVQA